MSSPPETPREERFAEGLPDAAALSRLEAIQRGDCLWVPVDTEKELLWQHRVHLSLHAKFLPKWALCVDWSDEEMAEEAQGLLQKWERPQPLDALELLLPRYSDQRVREYAVSCLAELSNREVADCALQLTNALRFETGYPSPLSAFLLFRMSTSLVEVGSVMMWLLKAQAHSTDPVMRASCAHLLLDFMSLCRLGQREMYAAEALLLEELASVAKALASKRSLPVAERQLLLRTKLAEVAAKLPSRFRLPLDPKLDASGILLDECRILDSKKAPFIVAFQASMPPHKALPILVKAGDDLRQDMLALRIFRIMDRFWRREGLDLRLVLYGCMATGEDVGMIEIVNEAETIAAITKAAGGASAAFSKQPIANWLRRHNPSSAAYDRCVENFLLSCAGCCVSTYLLGVADRHNDNLMLTRRGCLFHIDFGHILGNYKSKFGFRREKAPFVFTPDFAHVLGGAKSDNFGRFRDVCCWAYNVLRRHGHMFITLLAMMDGSGLPNVTSSSNIRYLIDALALHLSDVGAAEHFSELIMVSLKTKTTQMNNAIHILAH